jgi:hypothetical protein
LLCKRKKRKRGAKTNLFTASREKDEKIKGRKKQNRPALREKQVKKRGAKNKSPKVKEIENGNRTDQKTITQNHPEQTPSTSPEKQNR